MAGFCLAGTSAAVIRGKKSPLKLGQQLQPGAEVAWLGQDTGWSQPFLCFSGESWGRGRDLITGVSFPPGEGDLAGCLAGTWQLGLGAEREIQNKLEDEKHGKQKLVPFSGSGKAPACFRCFFRSRSHGLGLLQRIRAVSSALTQLVLRLGSEQGGAGVHEFLLTALMIFSYKICLGGWRWHRAALRRAGYRHDSVSRRGWEGILADHSTCPQTERQQPPARGQSPELWISARTINKYNSNAF